MTDPENPAPPTEYASFNTRVIADAIDTFILMLFMLPVINLLVDYMFAPIDMGALYELASHQEIMQDVSKLIPALWKAIKEQHILEHALVDNILQGICIAAYTLPFWFRYSATPGKMFFRLEIQDATTGARISRKQAVLRFLGYIVSIVPLFLGFIWIALNRKKQGFHDMIANTVVVVKPKKKHDSSTKKETASPSLT